MVNLSRYGKGSTVSLLPEDKEGTHDNACSPLPHTSVAADSWGFYPPVIDPIVFLASFH